MPERTLLADSPDGAALLRNEPVQARSTARLATLLDAAAAVVDEVGYERLTTAMVAERAGASIGTVYRYFPDRVVVLQGLSARYLQQFGERAVTIANDPRYKTWQDAVSAIIDAVASDFRREPGFRSLRFGDVLDLGQAPGSRLGVSVIAGQIADALTVRFDLSIDDLQHRLDVALTIVDALFSRAFAEKRSGDSRFLSEGKALALDYLAR